MNKPTLGAEWPIGTCGPLLDRKVNRIICLLAKINSKTNTRDPNAIKITMVAPEKSLIILFRIIHSSVLFTDHYFFSTSQCQVVKYQRQNTRSSA